MGRYIDKKDVNEFVKQLKYGTDNSFDALFTSVHDYLFCFFAKYTRNIHMIEDVVSEIMCVVYQKAQELEYFTNCYSWLMTISIRKFFKEHKKYSKIIYDDEMINNCGYKYNDNTKYILFEIRNLDYDSQLLIHLIHDFNFKQNQISKIMEISIATLKRRKVEIAKTLKERTK